MSKSTNNLKFKALFDWGIAKNLFERTAIGIIKKRRAESNSKDIIIKELEDE